MKKLRFVGTRNKTDFLLYLAHQLTKLGKSVLLVDGTQGELYSRGYTNVAEGQHVYDFQGIDILRRAKSWSDVEELLTGDGGSLSEYEAVLLDVDHREAALADWPDFDETYYVGDFDRYTNACDQELIGAMVAASGGTLDLKRVHYGTTYQINPEYTEGMFGESVNWRSVNYILEPDDFSEGLRHQMQHEETIPYKRLSKQYKEVISEVISESFLVHVQDVREASGDSGVRNFFGRFRKGQGTDAGK